jgi:hypothetical protein
VSPAESESLPEAAEVATEPQELPADDVDGQSSDEPIDELSKVRREAADRRVKLRETEAERDQLRGQLAALQRAEVERLAADRLADPSDLWRHEGVELEALLADDGTPDPEAVVRAAADVVKAHPSWGRPLPDLGAGPRPPAASAPSFGEALKRAGR